MLRRLICFEFSSRFSDSEKYEEEKILYKDRNVFKKDFLVKNLHYFRDLFVNIADFNEKAALGKYKRNAEYFRASLKY